MQPDIIKHKDIADNTFVIRIIDTNMYLIEMDYATESVYFKNQKHGWLLYKEQDADEMVSQINETTDLKVESVKYKHAFNKHILPTIQKCYN